MVTLMAQSKETDINSTTRSGVYVYFFISVTTTAAAAATLGIEFFEIVTVYGAMQCIHFSKIKFNQM